jgi:transposase
MEKQFLEECLAEGMSLETIGKRVGRHESTVEEMERLLRLGMSPREIAKEMDRSLATIRHWMRKYELKALPHRHDAPVDGARETKLNCRRHGRTNFVLEGRGSYRCKRCRVEQVADRRREIKRILVEEAGGKCVLCGYARHQEALQFHHLDPRKKSFHLGQGGLCRSLTKCRAEASKCALLCATCHAEVEAGKAALPLNSVSDANPG